jgi:hypothetical protein
VTIAALTPDAGPVGTRLTLQGSGFSQTGNTVTFAPRDIDPPGQMPNEPSVVPNLASEDGRTIVVTVLPVWRPACSYSPPGPCPIANIPTAPGSYTVSVANSNGTSNTVSFAVLR